MNSWIRNEICLEFGDINVESTVETERGGEGRNDLSNQSVKIGISGSFDIEISSTDVVDGFIVKHDGDIGMFKERMGGEDGVVWLNDSGGNLGRWVDCETELGFFSVID
jgi:hypothetical protein